MNRNTILALATIGAMTSVGAASVIGEPRRSRRAELRYASIHEGNAHPLELHKLARKNARRRR